jgi:hypothetical protein
MKTVSSVWTDPWATNHSFAPPAGLRGRGAELDAGELALEHRPRGDGQHGDRALAATW